VQVLSAQVASTAVADGLEADFVLHTLVHFLAFWLFT
jgi:hypothetical protein